jgi:hypothetical protein
MQEQHQTLIRVLRLIYFRKYVRIITQISARKHRGSLVYLKGR